MREYYTKGVPELCHAVKCGDSVSIKQMTRELAGYVPENGILIPAPQHCGFAVYTLELCKEIAMQTGATICDVLRCGPHESLYVANKKGHDVSLRLYLAGSLPEAPLFFVDNVIGTGRTMNAAEEKIGRKLFPLVYAVDSTRWTRT